LDAGPSIDCSPEVAEQVYNITREALINAARHAHAHRVNIRAGRSDIEYYVTIEDDGLGFDMSQPVPGGHFGLRVMQARAAFISGRIDLQSAPACGTRITLTWPSEAKN
jgi:signal transduction histidine kinase